MGENSKIEWCDPQRRLGVLRKARQTTRDLGCGGQADTGRLSEKQGERACKERTGSKETVSERRIVALCAIKPPRVLNQVQHRPANLSLIRCGAFKFDAVSSIVQCGTARQAGRGDRDAAGRNHLSKQRSGMLRDITLRTLDCPKAGLARFDVSPKAAL
jgi:hypothetical protein